MSDIDSKLKIYCGNCQCEAFKFRIQIPELETVMECNCSICFKKGYKAIVPIHEFIIEEGENSLKSYEFGRRLTDHKFCPTCGTGVFGMRKGSSPTGVNLGINARTVRDIDISALESKLINGAAAEPLYLPQKFTGPEPTANIKGAKLHTGGCHCGAVTIAFKAKPFPIKGEQVFEEVEYIQECNCRTCVRTGMILIYPHQSQVSISDPFDNLTTYTFGRDVQRRMFCKICSVSVCIEKTSPPKEIAELWPKARQEIWPNILPINLRCLDGVDWDRIDVKKATPRRNHVADYRRYSWAWLLLELL